jgi:mono/diheme cytochrome c family protein
MKTLPAEATPSEPHALPFPFNVRRGLGLWKLLFADGKTFVPDPARSAELNRGASLVEGPGHCAECHSPRNFLGGIIDARRFAGGVDAEGKGWVPNITPHADGLAKWSDKDIAYLLESGFTPDMDSVGSNMADVVLNTARLSPADRAAMAAYIKALPARPGRAAARQ